MAREIKTSTVYTNHIIEQTLYTTYYTVAQAMNIIRECTIVAFKSVSKSNNFQFKFDAATTIHVMYVCVFGDMGIGCILCSTMYRAIMLNRAHFSTLN